MVAGPNVKLGDRAAETERRGPGPFGFLREPADALRRGPSEVLK